MVGATEYVIKQSFHARNNIIFIASFDFNDLYHAVFASLSYTVYNNPEYIFIFGSHEMTPWV